MKKDNKKIIWVAVEWIPQIDGYTREISVPKEYANEVRKVLRFDPAMVDGLWCPVKIRDIENPTDEDLINF